MSEKPIALSKAIQWRLECLAYAVVERMAACLPGSWVFHLGEFFGGLAWHLMPKRRKIIERNLRIAYAGEKDLAEIQKLAKATMRRAGANLISAAHTASLRQNPHLCGFAAEKQIPISRPPRRREESPYSALLFIDRPMINCWEFAFLDPILKSDLVE